MGVAMVVGHGMRALVVLERISSQVHLVVR